MSKETKKVYQFKITLKGTDPKIWRRVQVPESYTFWDLHAAIQDAMSWGGYHLHKFNITNPKTGTTDQIVGVPVDENEIEIDSRKLKYKAILFSIK